MNRLCQLGLKNIFVVSSCLRLENFCQSLRQLGEAQGDGDVCDGLDFVRGGGDGPSVDEADDEQEVLSVSVRKQDVVGFTGNRKCILLKIKYCLGKGSKKKETRLGVDNVKPKGWFKYSLQID